MCVWGAFMGQANTARRRRSTGVKEHLFPISKFGKCAMVLWPIKPARALADLTGASERAANLWIAGRRRPSSKALIVLLDEVD